MSIIVKGTVVELAKDKGWIGQALRTIPDWILREADRRAEQDTDWQKRRNDPDRLPFPDPWQSLLDLIPDASPLLKKICRAAQSQIVAFRQITRLATGVATANTDWQRVCLAARATGDTRRSDHAANKVAQALSQFRLTDELRKEWVQKNPVLRAKREAETANWQKQYRAGLVHRGQRREAETLNPLPGWPAIKTEFPLETLLVLGWLRHRVDGPPGFMFWRKEPLTKLVLTLRHRPRTDFAELGRDFIKKLRQNLGLISVNDSACMIWDVEITGNGKDRWLVKGMERNGNLAFQETFPAWNPR